ncbi:MAG TPA: hypothetical protein VG940_06475, partial [Gemmatimonadales bacterium]|nr:hypothetical protein [Gemmatimonadales bacterium]
PALRDTFIARYRDQVRKGGGSALQQQFAAGIAGAPFPDRLPAFGDLLAGEDSTLWLLHIGVVDGAPSVWSVLDAAGQWLGEVTVPPAFRPTAVGRGWILGIQGIPTGGVRVRLYPLVER